MRAPSFRMIAAACFIAPTSAAHARSAYDGAWDLVFVTQSGACDPTYNFTINVSDGVVSHPNLVDFQGYIAKLWLRSCIGDGSRQIRFRHGRVFRNLGSREMERRAGSARCTGYWTSQRN